MACRRHHWETAWWAIQRGVDITEVTSLNESALSLICKHQQPPLDLVKALLHDDCVNRQDLAGLTPLHHAARSGNKELIQLLLGAGCSTDTRSEDYTFPLLLYLSNCFKKNEFDAETFELLAPSKPEDVHMILFRLILALWKNYWREFRHDCNLKTAALMQLLINHFAFNTDQDVSFSVITRTIFQWRYQGAAETFYYRRMLGDRGWKVLCSMLLNCGFCLGANSSGELLEDNHGCLHFPCPKLSDHSLHLLEEMRQSKHSLKSLFQLCSRVIVQQMYPATTRKLELTGLPAYIVRVLSKTDACEQFMSDVNFLLQRQTKC